MVRSFSNLESRTHWWNLTSSSSTLLLFPRPVDSNNTWRFVRLTIETTGITIWSHLVIQSQPQLWHSWQVDSHLDYSNDLRPQDVTLSPSKQVDALDDVEEDLILTVLDILWPPWHSVGDCWRWFGSSLQLVTFLEIENISFFLWRSASTGQLCRILIFIDLSL